jgi:hypothetical protein
MALLEDKIEIGGAGLNIAHLITEGVILACYPLHHENDVSELSAEWFGPHKFPWDQVNYPYTSFIQVFKVTFILS